MNRLSSEKNLKGLVYISYHYDMDRFEIQNFIMRFSLYELKFMIMYVQVWSLLMDEELDRNSCWVLALHLVLVLFFYIFWNWIHQGLHGLHSMCKQFLRGTGLLLGRPTRKFPNRGRKEMKGKFGSYKIKTIQKQLNQMHVCVLLKNYICLFIVCEKMFISEQSLTVKPYQTV